jgi:hypothetical protein
MEQCPEQRLTTKFRSWVLVFVLMIFLYIISFAFLLFIKPPVVLKKKEDELDSLPGSAAEKEENQENKDNKENKENQNTLLELTDMLCASSLSLSGLGPLGSVATQQLRKKITIDNVNSTWNKLRATKPEKCWEANEVNWELISIYSTGAPCLFLLLVVAAI